MRISAASEERVFAAGVRHPAFYFAALLSNDEILHKVRSFEHGMTDCYYRCLLQMGVERLLAVLASGSGRSDAWYREQLCLDESGGDIGDSRDEAPTALDSGDQDALAIIADAAPEEAERLGWTRKCVSVPPHPLVVRVYFDHYSHQSKRQRGWVLCPRHDSCIRYGFREGDVQSFAAEIYQWMLDGLAIDPSASQGSHLRWRPRPESCAALLQVMVRVDV